MKLNKKGFGVAEIAIVILLIGILAAAVIAGFMGIKQNANDVAEEQKEIAQTMSNELKHSFPTILSEDQKGLEIKKGEYEVYELGGYSITGKPLNGSSLNSGVINEGTLFITGNGTLDKSIAINSNLPSYNTGYTAIDNYGDLTLSDLVVIGGGKYVRSKNQCYAIGCYGADGKITMNNVYYNTTNGGFYVADGATLILKGTNTYVTNLGSERTGAYYFYSYGYLDAAEKVKEPDVWSSIIIEDGTYHMARWYTAFAYLVQNAKITVKGGNFTAASGATPQYGFMVYNDAKLEIEGGLFNFPVSKSLFVVSGSGQIVITGGDFVSKVTVGVSSGSPALKICGGAFAWDPSAYVDDESGAYTITKTSDYVCCDGKTRTMYVVTKNS